MFHRTAFVGDEHAGGIALLPQQFAHEPQGSRFVPLGLAIDDSLRASVCPGSRPPSRPGLSVDNRRWAAYWIMCLIGRRPGA
jgi:hypothetical protein